MKPMSGEGLVLLDSAPSAEWSFMRLADAAARARSRAAPVGPMHAAWDDISRAEELCLDARTLKEGELEELTRDLEAYGRGEPPGLARKALKTTDPGFFLYCHGDGRIDFLCDGQAHPLDGILWRRGEHVSLTFDGHRLRVTVFRRTAEGDEVVSNERVIPDEWISPDALRLVIGGDRSGGP